MGFYSIIVKNIGRLYRRSKTGLEAVRSSFFRVYDDAGNLIPNTHGTTFDDESGTVGFRNGAYGSDGGTQTIVFNGITYNFETTDIDSEGRRI